MTLLTAQEVAQRFGTTARNVRFWCEHGHLEAHKVGRDWVIDEAALETFERPQVGRPPKETATRSFIVFKRDNAGKISAYRSDMAVERKGWHCVAVPNDSPALISSAGRLIASGDAIPERFAFKQAAGDAYVTNRGLLFP